LKSLYKEEKRVCAGRYISALGNVYGVDVGDPKFQIKIRTMALLYVADKVVI
jgi:hypothetical protein